MLYKTLLSACVIVSSLSVSRAVLSVDDEYFDGIDWSRRSGRMEADRIDWSNHPCNRPCVDGGAPKICHYLFVVESYMSMSKACYDCPTNVTDCFRPHCIPADGVHKALYVANRIMPGPYIQVCLGDKIVVDVRNMLETASTTIHWHGLTQIQNPYMDGLPYVTQCPILPGNTFRYQFIADQSGTYWWHSHSGGQRSDGLFGGLTIRVPPSLNPHRKLYDFDEHSMIIIDWKRQSAEEFLLTKTLVNSKSVLSTILVNGFGRFKNFAKSGMKPLHVPHAVFNVKRGFRYRFRLVNAGAESCPIQMSIDNHTMTIISTDGNDIEPIEVHSIYSWPGERYDFIINAEKEIDNYWFRYRGHGGLCNNANNLAGRVYQVAILRYESAPLTKPKSIVNWDTMQHTKKFKELNPLNESASSKISLVSLKSVAANDITTIEKVDQRFYISYDLYFVDNYQYHRSGLYEVNQCKHPEKILGSLQLNHITFKMPPFPVLPQRETIKNTPELFCNSSTLIDKDCINEFCACTHMLYVKLNSVVELVIVDQGNYSTTHHPMHLHGYSFRIVAMGQLNQFDRLTVDQLKKLDRQGMINRNLNRPPLKDTVRVPNKGYTIVRFYANNPGYWFFHCHFDEHSSLGMALLFKVGEHEEMLPVPKNFPQCGSYKPNIMKK